MKKVKIPEKKITIEYVVKKSRFIATIEPFVDQKELKSYIKELREQHKGCSHVVYAFFLNDELSISGFSDDGEPHGTAGRPIYEVLKGSGLTNVLLTVVRYFGGIKLGTGGLVSAYSYSAKEVLKITPIIEKIEKIKIVIKLGYKIHSKIKKMLTEYDAEIIEEVYDTEIRLTANIPRYMKEEIEFKMNDLSHGELHPKYL